MPFMVTIFFWAKPLLAAYVEANPGATTETEFSKLNKAEKSAL